MNSSTVNQIFAQYGLATTIIAAASAAATVIINFVFGDRIPRFIRNYLPVILSLVAEFVYDMAAIRKSFVFSAEAFYTGLAAGSLSTAIAALVNKIRRGEPITFEVTQLFIEGLLEGFIDSQKKSAVAAAVLALINENGDEGYESLYMKIAEILDNNCDGNLTEPEKAAIINAVLYGTSTKNGRR